MNILAIDYGAKNIGLAWINTDVGVVLPYGVLGNQESGIKNQELLDLIQKEHVDIAVIGLPLGLDGKENKNTEAVRAFAEQLKKQVDVRLEFVDERFTSAEADRMEGGDSSRDERAAMIILQAYLDRV